MTTFTIKNIPDDIYQRLKVLAKSHRRSINNEVIHCLEMAVKPQRISAEEQLARFRAIRPNIDPNAVSLEDLEKAINEGRP